jgi:hypothetical protein
MAIELTGATIRFNNIDVTSFVRSVQIVTEAVEEMSQSLARMQTRLPQINLRYQGRIGQLSPRFYRQIAKRNHPRIRRMHSAYRQRRRGRW